ncbi:uncharacterized protein K489DRAFT_328791, partial [Dissoconium aciculare CBS 342.82]|uniref:Heterokaryon incompatibility domain-containing protein n=1 Tax=Dissoconium aciculare CBS 342.82 TaxID=1314786 RepID=A0A6J3LPI6_9PEZI
MSRHSEFLKTKLSGISAKTLALGGKQYIRKRNEQKIKYGEEFTHAPLSGPRCVRVLRIHPGEDTDLVACDLVEIDLDQDPLPAYEALSYSWNEDIEFDLLKSNYTREPKPDERPILCNGRTRHVTMNLYHALTEFRRQGFTTPLWADQ